MIDYNDLLTYIRNNKYRIIVRNKYFLLPFGKKLHITVFEDQWNDYYNLTQLPYHLFHISSEGSETEKCSIYFWVSIHNYHIKRIPDKYFKYKQEIYDNFKSTREKCIFKTIIIGLNYFRKILNKINTYRLT